MEFASEGFQPSSESMRIIEDCAKKLSPEDRLLAPLHDSYIANHKARIASDLDIAREHARRDGAVLEVGSVPLLFTAALAASSYHVTGIDIAPERYKTTIEKTGLNVVKCDIERERMPFADDSFDAVFFNELFEHLRINPIFTLSEVLRVMKPGAPLLLSSPNLRSLNGILNFLIRNRAYSCSGDTYAEYQKLERLGHMGHVREYTTREVIEFLEKVGFMVRKVIYRGDFDTGMKRLLARIFPGLRPFVSYVAEKPATEAR